MKPVARIIYNYSNKFNELQEIISGACVCVFRSSYLKFESLLTNHVTFDTNFDYVFMSRVHSYAPFRHGARAEAPGTVP